MTGADGRRCRRRSPATTTPPASACSSWWRRSRGKPLPLGDSAALGEREPALVATSAAREGASLVYVVSRRPFTGSWEYQLDSAIFTYPAVDAWSGAPLIGAKGELLGIGSLIVPDAGGAGTQSPGNMFVPVDLLKPILADLMAQRQAQRPAAAVARRQRRRAARAPVRRRACRRKGRRSAPGCSATTSCSRSAATRCTRWPSSTARCGRAARPASRCRSRCCAGVQITGRLGALDRPRRVLPPFKASLSPSGRA